MLPESKMNPLGMSSQGAANVMGGMGEMAASAYTPEVPQENPAEKALEVVSGKFRDAWTSLEDINGKFGGDVDKFRALQKAAEDWFTTIASNLPSSAEGNY